MLSSLNPSQQDAVKCTKGPLLILAGAGTGKTKALTSRVAYLIKEENVKPHNILAVTFTNKAANEMKERVHELIGKLPSYPTIGTFHSICSRILRYYISKLGYKQNFSIYDMGDQVKLIKEILKEQDLDPKMFPPKKVLSIISKAKTELIPPDIYAETVDMPFTRKIAHIYPRYQEKLKNSNAVDFDDILYLAVDLFRKFPNVLEGYQNQWKYIHIDEYQDTNYVQYIFVKMLAETHKNICVVGDDWQSIYSWRGADIRNILNFQKDYPSVNTVKLEINYRSTQNILDAADAIIKQNTKQTDKTLKSIQKEGEYIYLHKCDSEKHEADTIIRSIQKEIRNERIEKRSNAVILYRTNAQSRALEEACLRNAIPYQIIGGVKFYERREIKDILAYLTLIVNSSDTLALSRVVNTPTRGIGKTSWDKLITESNYHSKNPWEMLIGIQPVESLTQRTMAKFYDFVKIIQELQKFAKKNTASLIIKEVIDKTEYLDYLKSQDDNAEERTENLQELLSVSQKYSGLSPEESLPSFLEEIALLSDVDKEIHKDKLTLMTIHASKGLEFESIYIAGCEENLFPHASSQMDPEELEEERRLMYVAITRAKKYCHMSHATSRMMFGQTSFNAPSRFIKTIPSHLFGEEETSTTSDYSYSYNFDDSQVPLSEFTVGQTVTHNSWGKGKIREVKGDLLTISFSSGTRKVVASIAKLY